MFCNLFWVVVTQVDTIVQLSSIWKQIPYIYFIVGKLSPSLKNSCPIKVINFQTFWKYLPQVKVHIEVKEIIILKI